MNKTGYETTRIDVKEFGMHNIIVSMGLDSRQEYSGKVLDARTNQPLYGAVIEFKDGGKVIQTSTDVQGKYALMLTPLNNYDIEYSHDGYKVAKLTARPGLPGTGNEMATVFLEPAGAGTTSSVQRTDQPVVYSTDQPVVYSTNQPVVYSNTQTSRIFANETPTQYSTATQRQTTTLIPIQQPVPEPEFNGYSIQLAASPDKLDENSARQYEPLAKHGNLYVKSEDKLNKVRLGIFPTKDEASKKLKEVNKTPQFKGAFIVEERGADKGLIIGGAPVSTAPTQYSTASAARGVTTPAVVQNSDICYAVQLGSFSPDNPIAISDYAALSDVGNVYSKSKNGSLKMRLGVWPKYNDAEGAQAEAVKRGFKDAIIVTEVATDESIKGFMVAPKVAPAVESKAALAPTVYSTTQTKSSVGKYSIRLCALADPNRFDAGPLEAAGVDGMVEKRPIGKTGLTAILLSGYETQTAANRDKEKVRANGFPEAYLVEN
ncbi:MAG: carboxypeptidase-like regulatory domain-containing protein [Lewinellaceae bacterium]|nr:carboxypeptidase-like regulatory domain-containing protein [Lewinellaceae bacterium]